ncbi:putative MFS family arabinose efflux permease [Paraburkholderia sp. JPY465]
MIVLLVDYVARGLGRGAAVGANYWVLYGLAAIAGPMICGNLGDRIGFGPAWRAALALQAIAVVVLAKTGNPFVFGVATVGIGVFTPGIAPLVLGRIHELMRDNHLEERAAWSRATTAFALFQALGGYGYSYLFSRFHDDYALVFLCGAAALTLAFLADVIVQARRRKRHER